MASSSVASVHSHSSDSAILFNLKGKGNFIEYLPEHKDMDPFGKLPDELIIHILSFLPTKYAVLTSVLSRRWKFLWCYSNKSLVFDDSVLFKEFNHLISYGHDFTDYVLNFHNFIDRVIKLNKVPQVENVVLKMHSASRHSNLVSWIDEMVSTMRPKEVEIYFGRNICKRRHLKSLKIFNNTTLRVLKLQFSGDSPLTRGINNPQSLLLPNLKILHFWMTFFDIRWRVLISLIRASPQLEEAYIGGHILRAKVFFNIYAPCLKKLQMKFVDESRRNKFLINAPMLEELVVLDESFQRYIIKSKSLVNARLDIGFPYFKEVQHPHIRIIRVCKLLCRISHVKFLNLRAHTMDVLRICCYEKHTNLPQFPALCRLQLSFLNYSSWDVLPKVLECAPNLEFLVLSKDFKNKDAEFRRDSSWMRPSSVPACLLTSLHQVVMRDCESHQVEFDFISYLLEHGDVLSTFLVELLPTNFREDLRFREKLMMIPRVSRTCDLRISACSHGSQYSDSFSDLEEQKIHATELHQMIPLQKMCYEDLRLCTDYFSDVNLISRTREFEVYRGKIQSGSFDSSALKDVTVKKLFMSSFSSKIRYNERKEILMHGFREEVKLLKHSDFKCHPHFMSLLGYCTEDYNERLGMVYDFKALDSLEDYNERLDSFKWLQRIKVALVLACILEYMHKNGDLLPIAPKIKPVNVILDEDYMPKLFHFGLKRNKHTHLKDDKYGSGSTSDHDVRKYGETLLALISKRSLQHQCSVHQRWKRFCPCLKLDKWADLQKVGREVTSSVCKSQVALVHKELMDDPSYHSIDGLKITPLAIRCLDDACYRPSAHGIVKY